MTTTGYALITGASSGIGAAIAREYADRGKPLILTARRTKRLEKLAKELRSQVPCHVITCDLAVDGAPACLFNQTQSLGLFVDTLVNNAGYGVSGRYLSKDWQTHADFIRVMITSVAELTHCYLPAMEAAGHGRILNVASLAGLIPASAGHTLYGATKAWLIRFSECLALEMRHKGIHVTALCPGMTYSEFHDINGMREKVSRLPRWIWLDAEQVAKMGVSAVESGKARIVTGRINQVMATLAKFLPDAVFKAMIAGNTKDFRNAD